MAAMVERFAGVGPGNESNIENLIKKNLLMLEKSLKVPPRQYFQSFSNVRQAAVASMRQDSENGEFLEKIYPQDKSRKVTKVKDISEEENTAWMNPEKVLGLYRNSLTPFERHEILHYSKVYFIGSLVFDNKISGEFSMQSNYGYDDRDGSYNVVLHDHIAYRYEVLKVLGRGSFGQVVKAYDHKSKGFVALKIIRNDRRFLHQAKKEVKILEHLLLEDQNDTGNIVHIKNSFIFRSHMCIVFELMSLNLYELVKKNNFHGFRIQLVKNFAHSIANALDIVHRNRIIHGDLKPENILLKHFGRSGIKVIDFGSSCYSEGKLLTYVQSRFYRAPEVILGLHYDTAVDIWSLGCVLAELVLGYPALPGHNEEDQMALIIEMLGMPPHHLLMATRDRGSRFFSCTTGQPRYMMRLGREAEGSSMSARGPPGSRDLGLILTPLLREQQDFLMIDFIRRCLQWDPRQRITASMALRHPWLRT